jgi:hypothetical protein
MTVSDGATGRMLLSHNFDVSETWVPPLSREEFAAVFMAGLPPQVDCQPIEHPHWQVAIAFDPQVSSPAVIATLIAQVLAAKRQHQLGEAALPPILILGGLKMTPATGPLPALQPGEWGVDVVETESADTFLQTIDWAATVATRSPETVFKVAWPT